MKLIIQQLCPFGFLYFNSAYFLFIKIRKKKDVGRFAKGLILQRQISHQFVDKWLAINKGCIATIPHYVS